MFTGAMQISNQAVRETDDVRKHPLGQLAITRDGRKFRYARSSSTDLVAGNLLVCADPIANHTNILVNTAAAVGDRKVEVTLGGTAITADQYKGGYLVSHDGTGEGFVYQISGNQVQATTTGDAWIYLRDPVEVALATTSEVSLVYNAYDQVVISATDQADCPIGLAHMAVDASEADYFWVQTGGVAPGWADETYSKGAALTIGSSVAGQLEAVDAAGEPQVGIAIDTGVAGETGPVFLTLD